MAYGKGHLSPPPSQSPGALLRLTVPPDLSQVAHVRNRLAEAVGAGLLAEDRLFDLQVAVSEAVANAMEHAASQVELVAWLLPDRVIVEITNNGAFQPGLCKDDEHRRRGLGLPLMVSLADQVHVARMPQGKTQLSLTFFLEGYRDRVSGPPTSSGGAETGHEEKDAHEVEVRYQNLVELSPDAILVHSGGQCLFANPAAARLLGVPSPGDIIGTAVSETIHPDSREAALERIGQAYAGAVSAPQEIKLVRADGSALEVEVTRTKVRFDGRVAIQSVARELTERKRAEEEIRRLSQRLTYHMEHSPLAVVEWGPDMRLIRWSDEAERMFGWSADEVLGKRIEDFRWVYAEDKSHVADVSSELQEGTNPRRFSANRNYRKDGSVVDCEWYNSSLLDESGNLQSILSQVLDVTQRTRAEEETRRLLSDLQVERQRLAQLIDSITDEVWFVDTQERFTLANAAAFREFGVVPSDGISVEQLAETTEAYRPDMSPRPIEEAPPLRALAGEVVRNQEEVVRTPGNGKLRYRLVSAAPVRDTSGSVVGSVSVVRDITERKHAEEARRRSEEGLAGVLAGIGRLRLFERRRAWQVLPIGFAAQVALFLGVSRLESPSHYLGIPGAATALIAVLAAITGGPLAGIAVALVGGAAYFAFLTEFGSLVVWPTIAISILLWTLAAAAAGLAGDWVRSNAIQRERLLGHMLAEREALTDSLGVVNAGLQTQNEKLAAREEELQMQTEELAAQREELEAQNEELQDAQAETARLLDEQSSLFRRLQESLLDIPRELPGVRFAHLYRSATQRAQVGGDFYDVFEVKRSHIGLLIGDVSGQGLEAARSATMVKDIVHAFAHQFRRPHLVLREANRLLVEKGLTGFVTAFLGFLDPESGTFTYSSAGHPGPLLAMEGHVALLESIGLPLGVFADARYRDSETVLEKGSLLLFYTDGITEARRDGDFFGEAGLAEALGRMRNRPIDTLPSLLLDAALGFSGGLLRDDAALLAVRYLGSTGHEEPREPLQA